MAERALYQNAEGSDFPFEKVSRQLDWMPKSLSNHLAVCDYHKTRFANSCLLDTVLVFGGARTSALHGIAMWPLCLEFTSRLNRALGAVGQSQHRIVLVRRGSQHFFITCVNSQRFNWRTKLTHRDVGRNLDYFAPGHVFDGRTLDKASILFLEKTTMTPLFSEDIATESLEDGKILNKLKEFNSAKQQLFNETMTNFGLPYRFKWLIITPEHEWDVTKVIACNEPPDTAWWEDNCYAVACSGFPGSETFTPEVYAPFCSFKTDFRKHWDLVKYIYNFRVNYRRVDLWFSSYTRKSDWWDRMNDIFIKMRTVLNDGMEPEESDKFVAGLKAELEQLAKDAQTESYSEQAEMGEILMHPPTSSATRIGGPVSAVQSKVTGGLASMWDEMKFSLFQRDKLKPLWVREGIPVPADAYPDDIAWK
jgi:hypothetical protein